MIRRFPGPLALLVVLAAPALALAGCSSTSGSGPASTFPAAPSGGITPSTSPSTSPTSRPAASTTTVTRTAPPPRSSTPPSRSSTPGSSSVADGSCRDGQLRITAGQGDGAGGHNGITLQFRDVSPTSCVLDGYPGVDVLAADGQALAHARRTENGMFGGSRRGVPRVQLRSGGVASAELEWANADARHPGGGHCFVGAAIAVTAANTYDAVRFDRSDVSICALEVHPTVPGPTGSDPAR